MSKYCVAKPEPKWARVEYTVGDFSNLRVEKYRGDFKFSIRNGVNKAAMAISMDDMQDLIDSLQAFYDQEKGE